jgi:hypothetical protein
MQLGGVKLENGDISGKLPSAEAGVSYLVYVR